MTVRALPSDLVAKLRASRHHCDNRTELLLWLLDFMQRVRDARDEFDATADLVEYAGRLEIGPSYYLDELQTEWARLRLALRLARSERKESAK
jgi:hypothetical protein